MTYVSLSVALEPSAIADARLQLCAYLDSLGSSLETTPLPDAIALLETQLPPLCEASICLTWATAMEQLASELPHTLPVWVQALGDEGQILRLRAHLLPIPHPTL